MFDPTWIQNTISIRVLFWCLIYTHNIFKKLASFICAYFINFRFKVCDLAAVIIGIYTTWYFEDVFSYHQRKQLFTQKCATNCQTYFENQLNNFWTWNNSTLMKYHIWDSAEMDNNYMSTVQGSGAWYFETYCIKTLSGDSVFIRS